jgi:thiamine-phosphate pyrophosphorylase
MGRDPRQSPRNGPLFGGGMTLPTGLYAIADASFGDPYTLAIELAQRGCPVIQLRAKGWSIQEVAQVASQLIDPLHRRGAKLIINDHTAVASTIGADGVHLGQDDGSVDEARALLGPNVLIGLSTHSLEHVRLAKNVDYIGFGPVFETTTKVAAGQPRGLEDLRAAVAESAVPVIAIGGITRTNLSSVRATGTHGWAIVSDLYADGTVVEKLHHGSFQPSD